MSNNKQVQASYRFDKEIMTKLRLIASLKNISQVKLLEEYISDGFNKDKYLLEDYLNNYNEKQ